MTHGTTEQNREAHKKRRQGIRDYIKNYKKNKSCVLCGWKEHPEVLQFHHIKEKEIDLSKAAKWNMSKERIDKEILKCMLVCPNCHMWIHYE